MRPEKKYLIQEINEHLDKSNYFFLTDYSGVNVEEELLKYARASPSMVRSIMSLRIVCSTLLSRSVKLKALMTFLRGLQR